VAFQVALKHAQTHPAILLGILSHLGVLIDDVRFAAGRPATFAEAAIAACRPVGPV